MLHNTLKNFVSQYNEDAIKSLEVLSKNRSMDYPKYSFESFDIGASIKLFNEWMEFYTQYKCEHPELKNNKTILERCKSFIGNEKLKESDPCLFESCQVKYTSGANMVKQYIEGIQGMVKSVDQMTLRLYESGVDNGSISLLNEMADMYSDALSSRMDDAMSHFLKVSGYEHKIWLENLGKNKAPQESVVFA